MIRFRPDVLLGCLSLTSALAGCGDDPSRATSDESNSGSQGSVSNDPTTSATATTLEPTSEPTTAGTTSSGTQGTLTTAPTTGATDTGLASTGTDTGVSASSTAASTTGGPDLCLGGTLCGQVAVCCPAGNE